MTPSTIPAPLPLLLAAGDHTCAGWWHAPAGGGASLAVVLANSWGEEEVSAYEGQRRLACRLAEAGFGALRFDWPDTGDSSAPAGTTGVADALAAFAAAADRARTLAGGARLAFVGLRLGALFAAHAAAARDDVDAFVALLPVASGNAFAREQRLLGAVYGLTAEDVDGGVPLGGFTFAPERFAELAALRWPASAAASPRRALLLERPGMACRHAAQALADMGAQVRSATHADLSAVLAVAHHATLAPSAIEEIVGWLREGADERAVAAAGRAPASVVDDGWLRLRAAGTPVRERVATIPARGDDAPPLAGVLTEREPVGGVSPAGRRGLVLLSSAQERRIGPHRLWVPFARHRAACGDVVLRLDIAGVGDSLPRATPAADGTPMHYDPRCVEDVARAVAWLRAEHGVDRCTVAGLCSGAHHAWRAAVAGVDVQQVVPINPLVFHWKPGMSMDVQALPAVQIAIAARTGRALLSPARWLNLLRGRANVRLILAGLAARARRVLALRARELARLLRLPVHDALASELADVCGRGVAVDFVFSSGEPGLALLREESGRALARLERDRRVHVRDVERADHTFAGAAARRRLYGVLDALLDRAPAFESSRPGVAARASASACP